MRPSPLLSSLSLAGLSLAGLTVLGASFGIGLLVLPANKPTAPTLAVPTLAATHTLIIVPEPSPPILAAEIPAASPAAPAEPHEAIALLFDPTPTLPQKLVAPPPPVVGHPASTPAVATSNVLPPVAPPVVTAAVPVATPAATAEAPPRIEEPARPAERTRKKPTRQQVASKRAASGEALRTVRRFGDDLRDIPVRSFSGTGKPLDIRIRPTSIQDVYYYSSRQ